MGAAAAEADPHWSRVQAGVGLLRLCALPRLLHLFRALPPEATASLAADADTATTADPERTRFLQELEFVCCLANPKYLSHLAQGLYFEDPAFVHYLDYLQYWRRAEYASFVVYPHALHFLELLQHESFRKAIKDPAVAEQIHCQQFYHWENRARLVEKPAADANGAAATSS